ncbi:MAG: asparagine synthase (glutamine-hydrolyzing) [Verrucomicrobiota bacterium]
MCGFVVAIQPDAQPVDLTAASHSIRHRGPDDEGRWSNPGGTCHMAFRRLSILDLSSAGHQPMHSKDGRYTIVFNGEIYNYLELKEELDHRFDTESDTEVLLAAYAAWKEECLHRLNGMFAFAIWDEEEQKLFAARDRFGVKPLFFHVTSSGALHIASEIKALGARAEFDTVAWADYLVRGMYDHGPRTFWNNVTRVLPGHRMTVSASGDAQTERWYDLPTIVGEEDDRDEAEVADELLAILESSIRFRFRSDVPVGVCLSGGLDSSLLLGLMHRVHGADSETKTFTFMCGDPDYDETPWVEEMLKGTSHPSFFCRLRVEEVPELCAGIQASQDEPFGGLPTLGMAMVHRKAREEGVIVLLDGNGMDEGWAGYEYYQRVESVDLSTGPVQGSRSKSIRNDCLVEEFAEQALDPVVSRPFNDPLRDTQFRDLSRAKIPRAMRFADRVSMMFSRELREPFLDHRLIELGLRQPASYKIRSGQGKFLPRQVAGDLLPRKVSEAPKRPVQTPQREWLRGPLASWAESCIDAALQDAGGNWLDPDKVRAAWRDYRDHGGDNSFPIWQWISLGLVVEGRR